MAQFERVQKNGRPGYEAIVNGEPRFFPDEKYPDIDAVQARIKELTESVEPVKRDADRSALRDLGLGVRDVVQGLSSIPGLVYDAAALPVQAGVAVARQLGSDVAYLPPASRLVSDALTKVGLPTPETGPERVRSMATQGAAAAIPTMGAGLLASGGNVIRKLAERPLSQLISGFTGGGSAQVAAEAGASAPLQIGAGLLGGVGGAGATTLGPAAVRAADALKQPFMQAGRDRMAADVLLRTSANPGSLVARIEQGLEDTSRRLPGSPVTTAQAARDPGLMVLEQGLAADAGRVAGQGGQSGAVAFRDIAARRNQSRTQALQPTGSVDGAGATLRAVLGEKKAAARERVSAAFKGVDPDNSVRMPFDEVVAPMIYAGVSKYGPGRGPLPPAMREITDEIMDEVGEAGFVGFEWFQNMRSRLGEEAGKARLIGADYAADAYAAMRTALEDQVNAQVMNGRNFSADQIARWGAAIKMRRNMGETFERATDGGAAVASILKQDRFNRPILADSKVVATALASPENLRQVLRAAGNAADEVRAALRNEFIRRGLERAMTAGVMADAVGDVAPVLSGAGFSRFMEQNKNIIPQLFNTKAHAAALQRIANDFTEGQMSMTMGKARGSDTTQNLTVANVIGRATNGIVSPDNPLAKTLVGLGPIVRFIYQAPEAAVRELIIEAASDPVLARQLLVRAGPDAVKRASTLLQPLEARFADIGSGIAARQAVRVGGLAGSEQPQQ
jgi:hypothetical protein